MSGAAPNIELFWASGSPFAWRVLLALEWKGLPYQSHLLQLSQQEHKAPTYLALNPRGQVPTLRDGELVVCESVAMLAYLDRQYPQRPLFGATAAEAAGIWQRVLESVSYLDEPTEAFILPLYFGQTTEKRAALEASIPHLHAECARLETALGARPWLCSAGPTAADFVTYPQLRSIVRAAGKPAAAAIAHGFSDLGSRYPGISAWMARLEALPFYDRTFPPHWRAG